MSYEEEDEFGGGVFEEFDDNDEALELPDDIAELEDDSDDPEDRYH